MSPLRHRAGLNAKLAGDVRHQAAACSDKGHPLHDDLTSATDQAKSITIGDRIRAARTKAGMTQRALAKELEVTQSAVGQWETYTSMPTMENRADLTRVLGIPFVELLPEAGAVGELTISDPTILAIVRQLLILPPRVREAFLMQVSATVATVDSLAVSGPQGQATDE